MKYEEVKISQSLIHLSRHVFAMAQLSGFTGIVWFVGDWRMRALMGSTFVKSVTLHILSEFPTPVSSSTFGPNGALLKNTSTF
jgi:hypothetical protein